MVRKVQKLMMQTPTAKVLAAIPAMTDKAIMRLWFNQFLQEAGLVRPAPPPPPLRLVKSDRDSDGKTK